MAKKARTYQKKPFESSCASNDTFAGLYMSMLCSPAYRDLSVQQKVLYTYCKAQYYAEKKKPEQDELTFTMNKSKWCSLYGLYKANNSDGFTRDMSALITHGFISCVKCGRTTRTKSIYRFSDKWQLYGTEDFKINANELNDRLLRELRGDKQLLVDCGGE